MCLFRSHGLNPLTAKGLVRAELDEKFEVWRKGIHIFLTESKNSFFSLRMYKTTSKRGQKGVQPQPIGL